MAHGAVGVRQQQFHQFGDEGRRQHVIARFRHDEVGVSKPEGALKVCHRAAVAAVYLYADPRVLFRIVRSHLRRMIGRTVVNYGEAKRRPGLRKHGFDGEADRECRVVHDQVHIDDGSGGHRRNS